MGKRLIIGVLLVVVMVSSSCSKNVSQEESGKTITDDEIYGLEEAEDDSNKVISPLNGLKYYPEELSRRPVAVSLDNHPDARWQAGLNSAEIIYEFEVEYPYTRYLAIYLAKEPELVGPVRSARPYIIYYAMENDAIFVHVGGSEDAFAEIKRLGAADVDGLYSNAMWRYSDTGKFAPHNMYTTLKSIREEADRFGFRDRDEVNFEKYNFNEKSIKLSEKYSSSDAKKINITYNKENTTDYIYDEESKLYLRFKDNQKHLDELDNEQLKAKNIVVLETSKDILDSAGRLYLETIGSGNGIYFTEGQSCDIIWKKDSEKDRTEFYIDGEDLYLNPGNTWIQIVDSINAVTVE